MYPILKLLASELEELDKPGIKVFDDEDQQVKQVRARLFDDRADLPGASKVFSSPCH
jgi:hypothetical protein